MADWPLPQEEPRCPHCSWLFSAESRLHPSYVQFERQNHVHEGFLCYVCGQPNAQHHPRCPRASVVPSGVPTPPPAPQAVQGAPEIRNDNKGNLDEFIAKGCDVHVERMNNGHWWMGVDMPDGSLWHLNFSTRRNTEISCFAERDAPSSNAGVPSGEVGK
jgi:hypothetical protein